MPLETFSYLPPLTRGQVRCQIDYLLRARLYPVIEYTVQWKARDYYWSMWKLPLFSAGAPEDVLIELLECRRAHPDTYVRLSGYDPVRQTYPLRFVVFRPGQDPVSGW